MSKVTNLPEETEELSRLLDKMNCRQQPQSENPETIELLAVAELLKKTGLPAKPPQQIIDQTVNQIMTETNRRKTKPCPAWLYSGILGTAAAVLLVIGLNLPSIWSPQEQMAALPPVNSSTIQEPAPETVPKNQPQEPLPAEAPQKTAATQPPVSSTPASVEKTTVTEKAAPIQNQSPANTAKSEPKIAMRTVVIQDQPPAEKQPAAILSNKSANSLPLLSLPDKKPDTVITDSENGTIHQIYEEGTPKEFTITQQVPTSSGKNTQAKDNSTAVSETDKTNDKIDSHNKITINLYDQQVTIEGPQTKQELLNLVQSLVP